MSKRWLKDFLRYIHKVFLPESWTKWAKDERKDPEIEPGTIWVTLLIGFALQIQSLEELERRARNSFKKLLPRGQRPPSADTVRHSSIGMELAPIKKLIAAVNNKARAGAVLPTTHNETLYPQPETGTVVPRRNRRPKTIKPDYLGVY